MDKNKKKKILGVGIGVIAAIGLLAFAILLASAASDVTGSSNYQGRLTDSAGEPLSGAHEMTFKLYEVDSGGTALVTDTHSVTATNGLFNTNIDFGTTYFDGRALWLGITVGSDSEMTPRQRLRPVPYALSLKPGAAIIGSANTALHAESTHPSGRGIRGYATATSGTNYGVVGASGSPDGYGGCFYNNEGGIGVYGEGKYGGHFTTNQGGTYYSNKTAGVTVTTAHDWSDGVRASTSGLRCYGVYAHATGKYGSGVYASTTGYGSSGVVAETRGDHSKGFWLSTYGDHSEGVCASTHGDESDGVYARTYGDSSHAVHAYSAKAYGVYGEGKYGGYFTTNQDEGAGIYAHGGSSGYAAVFRGNVKITSQSSGATIMELGEGLDYAEGFDVSDLTKIEPGSVLIIDPDNPGKLTLSNTPYDTKVAGIVAGANETGSGVRLGTDQFDYDVALAGRVYCNVDATEEGVEPGDMLTTSATPGYAMKSTDYMRAQGAILGKAMQRLEKGEKGQIQVLVTLQ
jgi:hypothetical protein